MNKKDIKNLEEIKVKVDYNKNYVNTIDKIINSYNQNVVKIAEYQEKNKEIHRLNSLMNYYKNRNDFSKVNELKKVRENLKKYLTK